MTNEDILKLAETCGIGANKYKICISWEDQLLKFARELYDEGYTKGFKVGHDAGWELNDEVSRRGL